MATVTDLEVERVRIKAEKLRRARQDQLRGSLALFVQWAWTILEPGRQLRWNWSVELICRLLEGLARRDYHRVIINIPPRAMKSTLVSVCYPIWVWIQDPDALRAAGVKGAEFVGPYHQFLTLANGADLALRDAVHARNLLESEAFTELFGDWVWIPDGQNEKRYYKNQANGHRNAQPISGRLTGKGGDTILIDDPHDADQAQSDTERQNVLDAYAGKVTSRLNDQSNGAIAIIMQRVHGADLVNFVLKKDGVWSEDNPGGWVHLVLPMRFELDEPSKGADGIVNPAKALGFHDPRTEKDELLWPERFPETAVKQLESDLTATSGVYGASCQLQQRPAPAEGGILRKSYWRRWPDDKPLPVCDHIFLSWDTAYTEKDMATASFSARTAWGVFWNEQDQAYQLILLHKWADRVAYPELREKAQGDTHNFAPDAHLIEKKASGISLVQDLRRAGRGTKRVRLRTYMPDRDKIARAHAATSAFSAGLVWAPNRKWADETIEACGIFPNGAPPSADITDTVTQAVLYLSRGWWVEHPDDVDEEQQVGGDIYADEDDIEVTPKYGYYG